MTIKINNLELLEIPSEDELEEIAGGFVRELIREALDLTEDTIRETGDGIQRLFQELFN